MPPIEVKILFAGLLVGIAHIVSGVAVLVTVDALSVTPLASLVHLADLLGYTQGRFVSAVLVATGVMAVVGSQLNVALPRRVHALMFLPQQVLLMLTIWTITLALIEGKYPDGYIPQGGAWFILTDQIWTWLLAVSHSIWLAAFLYGGVNISGIYRGT
jgi:hypothetical protein